MRQSSSLEDKSGTVDKYLIKHESKSITKYKRMNVYVSIGENVMLIDICFPKI